MFSGIYQSVQLWSEFATVLQKVQTMSTRQDYCYISIAESCWWRIPWFALPFLKKNCQPIKHEPPSTCSKTFSDCLESPLPIVAIFQHSFTCESLDMHHSNQFWAWPTRTDKIPGEERAHVNRDHWESFLQFRTMRALEEQYDAVTIDYKTTSCSVHKFRHVWKEWIKERNSESERWKNEGI